MIKVLLPGTHYAIMVHVVISSSDRIKYKVLLSIINCMIKLMYVDNVFEVLVCLNFIFGYFFYARRDLPCTYSMMLPVARRQPKNFRIQATNPKHPHQRWKRDGRKKLFLHPHIPS